MGAYVHNDETYNFNFGTDLSVTDKARFVNAIVDFVVDENHYNSVIRDLIFDFYVIDIMTDISTAEFKQSETFFDDVEQFLDETNIIDIVKANAFPTLFDELNNAVDKSIEYLTGIHPNLLNDALTSLVNALEKKVNEIDLDSAMNMAKLFTGMTEDFTPENIVNAYMTSDMHKKNMDSLEESKKQKLEFAKDMDKAIKSVKGGKTKSKK